MTSILTQDAALCLRVDLLSPYAPRSGEGSELRCLDLLLRVAAQRRARLQFCLSAGWITDHAGQLTQVLAAGHAVDGCLYASTEESLADIDSIRRQLEEMESAFRRAKASRGKRRVK